MVVSVRVPQLPRASLDDAAFGLLHRFGHLIEAVPPVGGVGGGRRKGAGLQLWLEYGIRPRSGTALAPLFQHELLDIGDGATALPSRSSLAR